MSGQRDVYDAAVRFAVGFLLVGLGFGVYLGFVLSTALGGHWHDPVPTAWVVAFWSGPVLIGIGFAAAFRSFR